MTGRLENAFDTLGRRDISTLTGAAMAGREAIQAIVSDLPHSPERTEIVSDTGADMQVQLMTHRDGKAAIDEAYNAALRELSDFTASQPTLDEMIASAQAELDSGQ